MASKTTSFTARANRPRRLPKATNFVAQLSSGRVTPAVRSEARDRALQMGADLPLLAYIVDVVITVERLICLPMDEAAFVVAGEGGHRQLRWVDIAAEKLPSLVSDRLMRVEIRQQYAQYRFHPYFDLFLRCLDEGRIEQLHRLATELPTHTANESPARAKLRLSHLRDSCAELNACAG